MIEPAGQHLGQLYDLPFLPSPLIRPVIARVQLDETTLAVAGVFDRASIGLKRKPDRQPQKDSVEIEVVQINFISVLFSIDFLAFGSAVSRNSSA
jgi:hypothetical protein